MLNIIDTWIKATVEHRIINIDYYSWRTKHEYTNRDIEPDFVGLSRDGKNQGLWATFCHLRHEGPRCFKADSIRRYSVSDRTFIPSALGRWNELIPLYEQSDLKNRPFR